MKFTRLFVATLAMAGLMFGCGDDSKDDESGAPQPENTAELCADGQDNDGNGKSDCDEDSCKDFDNCKTSTEDKECPAAMPDGKKDCTCDKTVGEWKDCQDIGSEEKECPEAMPDGKKDCSCDKSTGEWKDCQDIGSEEKECPTDMPEGKKDCTCDKTTGEWADCQDIGAEEKECPADMPEGKKDCTCDKTTGEWADCQDIGSEEKECSADMPEGKKDCTCDKSKGEWKDCKDIGSEDKECSADMPEGKKDCTCDKTTGEWKDCKDDVTEDKDENKNHMKDSKEPHISSATACTYHSDCADTNFCDHFIAGGTKIGKCADKCTGNDDCMEGFICRPDGRCAAEAFETVWKTTKANEEIELPSGGNDAVCKATVDWGDGSAAEEVKECPKKLGDLKHKYAKAGEYHVKITGTWDGWCMGTGHIDATCLSSNDMAAKLIEVVSYGPVGLGVQGFASAKNLAKLSTIDIPDASKLGQKNGENVYADDMFYGCENLEKGLAKWDISNVTGLKDFFSGAKKFNENIYGWDTSSVTDFYGMFWGAEALTTNPANSWDLSNAQSMGRMFSDTTKASLNFQHTKASKPEKITSCEGIKDMYTGSAVDCDIVKIAGEDVEALKNCKNSDYKAECK